MLPLIFDEKTEIIIFGSYPGEMSLLKQQYYGNPGNHFWRIMSEVLGEDLVSMDYEHRIRTLLKHKIGLWDTWESVERNGSLDSAIRNAKMNDFSTLKRVHELRLIAFNGQSSGKAKERVEKCGYKTVTLPSSSAAHTVPLAEKTRRWKDMLERKR